MRKKVVFIADSLDNAYKFQQVLSGLDVEIAAGSTVQIKKLLAPSASVDLIVFEARGSARASLGEVIALADDRSCPMLVIVDEEEAERVKLPTMVSADFVVHGAGIADTVENMTINLATYQVTVGGNPIDFTYLEYALLSFLVRHPGHTFSRDALLQHVWGFDYYGGSRTVDVHVRRIRAKLGPELAQRLETVRGVGYLWSS